ncbi:MAG: ankyrin repeat domain-containing protein [Campylobacter sp.]|nr:ankyrin repeat domain-containing protein [Campylobacter sp.]
MAKKRKTLPKDFDEMLARGDTNELQAVFDKCEIEAYDSAYSKRTALAHYRLPAQLVKWLVDQGANVNSRDYYERTPIFHAASIGDNENLTLLISFGADVNAVADYGDTPLHFAANYFKPKCVRILLDAGADASAKGGMGDTPLESMLRRCRNADIAACADVAELLLKLTKPTEKMQDRVRQIGEDFEFHRTNFNKDYRRLDLKNSMRFLTFSPHRRA